MTEPKEKEKDPEDLLEIFTKPIDEMESIEEIQETLAKLRKLRSKVRISTKKKTELDMILEKLTPEQARKALETLEPKKQEVKTDEKRARNECGRVSEFRSKKSARRFYSLYAEPANNSHCRRRQADREIPTSICQAQGIHPGADDVV